MCPCEVPGVTVKSSDAARREATATVLATHGLRDYEFWTDASVEDHRGAAAAILYATTSSASDPTTSPPCKRRCSPPPPPITLTAPAGLLTASCPAELIGLRTSLTHIINNQATFRHKRILIATDSQSCLRALSAGPLQHHERIYIPVWEALAAAAKIAESIIFQFVCSHCGTARNEAADEAAKQALDTYTTVTQATVPITVASIASDLRAQLHAKWMTTLRLDSHRMRTVGMKPSHLNDRSNLPRIVQTTYSQWRCGEILHIGPYPRRLGHVHQTECRWCQGPVETAQHLLMDCPAVASYRGRHQLSLETLKADTEEAANAIHTFQQHLLSILPTPLTQPLHGRARAREVGDDNVPPTARRRLDSRGADVRGRTTAPRLKSGSAANKDIVTTRAGPKRKKPDGSQRKTTTALLLRQNNLT